MLVLLFIIAFIPLVLACDDHLHKELRKVLGIVGILFALVFAGHLRFANNQFWPNQKALNISGSNNIIR